VGQERPRGDERVHPVHAGEERTTHGGRKLRPRLGRWRRDELEKDAQVPHGDLAARALVEQIAGALSLFAQAPCLPKLRQRDNLIANRNASIHCVGKMRDVAPWVGLEKQATAWAAIGGNAEGGFGRPADADVVALTDQALFNDPAALDDPDAENTRLPGGGSAGSRC